MRNILVSQYKTNDSPLGFAAALIACAALLLTDSAAYGAGATTRISVDSSGVQGDNYSRLPVLSADGRYVAFASEASNLVAGDTNYTSDIFVGNLETGVTTRVSVDSSGTQTSYYGNSFDPALSADGRIVAFTSFANDITTDDTNWKYDIFVHDRETGATTRVSTNSSGAEGNGDSYGAAISADGRFVAFDSSATNLVADDTNGASDVFVHDRMTGVTTRVSVSSTGAQGNNGSSGAAISADGRYVAFSSSAATLVADDTNGVSDVFVHDRMTGMTTRVSLRSDGEQANEGSGNATLSADGRYIAFSSGASNLVENDHNWDSDIFIHDRETAETIRISVNPAGIEANDRSYNPALSSDGHYIAFSSSATNLVSDIKDNTDNIFIRDNQTGAIIRANVSTDGIQPQGIGYYGSDSASLSADGHIVVFSSYASSLVANDTNGAQDIFTHEWSPTFSILKTGAGSGLVTSIPAGISCGSNCSAAFEKYTSITLMAQADNGSEFTGWNGPADCTDGVVTFMDDLMSCTASFVPIVTVAATRTATEAGPISGIVTFTRTGSTAAKLTVHYAVTGTAISGIDYTPLFGSVTFERFSSTAMTYISPVNDHLVEPNETVNLQLMPSDNYVIGTTSTATVQIIDIPEVTVTATDPIATEAGLTSGKFTFTRTGSVTTALTVNLGVGGTASIGRDYRSIGTSVTFPIGRRTVTKTVTPIDDSTIEPKETVDLTLKPSGYYNSGSRKAAKVGIISDEIPTISVVALDTTATETGHTTGKFRISRNGSLFAPLKVYFKMGGTATARADYQPLGTDIVFGPGVSAMVGTLVPISDNLKEPNEQVILTISPNNSYTIAPPGSAAITISDN